MINQGFKIRVMKRAELDIAIKWAANEGWNPGIYDADAFYATDLNGYFMGLLDNEPISCISAVSYGGKFGFLGFYITQPKYRGKGYGIQVWHKAMEYLDNQNIGLDGVVAQQENYKKSGFKLAYRNIRYQGKSKQTDINCSKTVELSTISFTEILKYDSLFFPEPRAKFLEGWLKLPESYAIGYIRNDKLLGYSVIRKCKIGFKIGPLFADNGKVAEELFLTLNNHIPSGSSIFLDIPEVNSAAIRLAENNNMDMVFETARMYTKEPPKIDLNSIFGVTTFELG